MRRRTLILATAAALAAPLTAFATRDHHVRPSFPAPKVSGAPGQTAMLFAGVMPVVAATIDGKGPFKLAIDTGSPGYLSLNAPIAQALGLKVSGKAIQVDPSGRNPVTMDRYKLDALALAGLTFHDLEVEGMPAIGGKAPPFDGILGMNLFDAHTLVLDFKGKVVGVSTARLPAADGAAVIAYPPGPLIQLPVAIGGTTLQAHLDTGQQIAGLMVPTTALPRLAVHGEPRRLGVAHTVSEAYDLFAVGIDAAVKVGATPLPVTEVAYPTVVPVANIGARALAGMTVAIDRPSRTVRLQA